MEAVFPPEFHRTGTVTIRIFPLTGNKTETLISCWISKGISQYPSGIDRKREHIRPSTTHPRLFLGFHQTFPSISPRISLDFAEDFTKDFTGISSRISPRISLGSFPEFLLGFTRNFPRISRRFD